MRTKTQWKRAVCASMLVLAVGCRTPSAMGPLAAGDSSAGSSDGSDSGNSSQGDSSKSDSGNSSDGNSSKSDSGNSSDGNSSKSESGNSSDGNSSESESSNSSDNSSGEGGSSESRSSDNSSGSSDDDSGTSHSENAEGKDSKTESDSSQSKDGNVMSATTVAATVIGLGVVIWQAYAAAERRRNPPAPKEVGRAAQVYLRARSHQLREDLALGAGPTVEDLAAAARIRRSHLGTFGRLLRTHRQELLALADARTLTPERALAWMERVGELARTDPRLEEDRRAFLAEDGVAEVAR